MILIGFNCDYLFLPILVFYYILHFVRLMSHCTCEVFVVGNDVVES